MRCSFLCRRRQDSLGLPLHPVLPRLPPPHQPQPHSLSLSSQPRPRSPPARPAPQGLVDNGTSATAVTANKVDVQRELTQPTLFVFARPEGSLYAAVVDRCYSRPQPGPAGYAPAVVRLRTGCTRSFAFHSLSASSHCRFVAPHASLVLGRQALRRCLKGAPLPKSLKTQPVMSMALAGARVALSGVSVKDKAWLSKTVPLLVRPRPSSARRRRVPLPTLPPVCLSSPFAPLLHLPGWHLRGLSHPWCHTPDHGQRRVRACVRARARAPATWRATLHGASPSWRYANTFPSLFQAQPLAQVLDGAQV